MTFNVRADRTLVGTTEGGRALALATITAPDLPPKAGRIPVNVAIVLDRSGSMGGQKIRLARAAVQQALGMLHPTDRFALVAFDHEVTVLTETAPASREAVDNALRQLAEIDARGNTDLSGGWLRGCEQVALGLEAARIGRCLLLTDGLANHGITDPAVLSEHATALRQRGIVTSTFGIGADFDENLLQQIATAGGGHFYFVEKAVQIPDLLTSELGEALEVAVRDVVLDVHGPAGVKMACLNDFPVEPKPAGPVVRIGDLVSGQELAIVVEFHFERGNPGQIIPVEFVLSAEGIEAPAGFGTLTWMVADDDAVKNQPCDWVVVRAWAERVSARARLEALALNRSGRYADAGRAMRVAAELVLREAGADEAVREIGERMRLEADGFEEQLSAMESKQRHFAATSVLRERTFEGKSRRK